MRIQFCSEEGIPGWYYPTYYIVVEKASQRLPSDFSEHLWSDGPDLCWSDHILTHGYLLCYAEEHSELVSMKRITELRNIRYKMNSVRHKYRRQTPTSKIEKKENTPKYQNLTGNYWWKEYFAESKIALMVCNRAWEFYS